MTDDEIRLAFEETFSTFHGEKTLKILREMSGYDRRCMFSADARREAYDLGRASLFADILDIIQPTKKDRKNGRHKPEPEF